MPVCYKCKICGGDHLSTIAFGYKMSFEPAIIKDISFQCSETKKSALCKKDDIFWKD